MSEGDQTYGIEGFIHRNGGQSCGELHSGHGGSVSHDMSAPSEASALISRSLACIGWTVVQAEKRSGVGRNRISRWLSGQAPYPPFVQWLTDLAKWHQDWPRPLARPLVHTTNRPPMKGREFHRILLVIGCSERVAVLRMGHNRARFRAALAQGGSLTTQESLWLRYLELGHLTYPSPVASSNFFN